MTSREFAPRTESSRRGYLECWALLDEDELAAETGFLGRCILAHHHGWGLLEPHVANPACGHHLLTGQVSLAGVHSSGVFDIKLT